jgi:general secretion pathway protein I
MSRGKSGGFTLLEVLIALVIVALAVGALLGTVTSSASNIDYLRQKTVAEWVALNRLTEVRIAQQFPDKGRRTGNAEMAGMRWQWEEEVTELPVKGMFRIEIRARPTGDFVDDRRKPAESTTAQKETESKRGGSELDKLNWTTSVFGVMGTSQSARRESIASGAAFIGEAPQGGPNNPNPNPGQGPPKGAPGTPDR